jgi:hypothetical protein
MAGIGRDLWVKEERQAVAKESEEEQVEGKQHRQEGKKVKKKGMESKVHFQILCLPI